MNIFGGFETGSVSYIGLFIGALLIYDGLWQILSRAEVQKTARNRRMKMIAAGASGEEVLQVLKPNLGRGTGFGPALFGRLRRDLRQAGVTLDPAVLMIVCLAGAVFTAIAATLYLPAPLAAALAIGLWLLLPLAVVRQARTKRLEHFGRQLPEALDLMSRGLRVGHPLNVTIASVAEEMTDPIASEFGVIVDQVAYGDTLVDAVLDLADRVPTEDMRYIASAVSIQHGTGGDLAGMLSTLAKVIRDRRNLRRKVRSISAEGRLSALFLSALPFLMMGMMTVVAPSYYGDVSNDPAFVPGVSVVFGLVALNAILLRRLVNFRI